MALKCKFSTNKFLAGKKKIISFTVKLIIGILCTAFIYWKLRDEFDLAKRQTILHHFLSARGLWSFAICFVMIPVNWGIESYKWMLITSTVEKVNYFTATKSQYSGVCLGNLAPARATEFVGKIIYFQRGHRSKITVLHFIHGLFQLVVTVVCGFLALIFSSRVFSFPWQGLWWITLAAGLSAVLLLAWCIIRWNDTMKWVTRKILRDKENTEQEFHLPSGMALKLVAFSFLRYVVFFIQFLLLLNMFEVPVIRGAVFTGVAFYFLVVTLIPMHSTVEAFIRAAVAIIVFGESQVDNSILVLVPVMLWALNIAVPSVIGYYFLWKEEFNFGHWTKKNA